MAPFRIHFLTGSLAFGGVFSTGCFSAGVGVISRNEGIDSWRLPGDHGRLLKKMHLTNFKNHDII